MTQSEIIIVGAGAAGLMAARELSKAGKKVLILEARDRVGGRIFSLPEAEWGYEAQGGAELVHGEAPTTRELTAEAGLTITPLGEWWSVRSGKPERIEGPVPHDPALKAKLNELKEDIPVTEFFAQFFPEEKYELLRAEVYKRIENYYAGDPAKTSSFALREEINDKNNSENFRIKEGYGALVRYLQQECEEGGVKIVLNKQATQVALTEKGVNLQCVNESKYEAPVAIITVPLPLLRDIEFIPALPKKLQAATDIGYGSALKIALRFRSQWWAHTRGQDFSKLSFMRSNEPVAIWWTQYPEPHTTLIGWMGGPQTERFANIPDEETVEQALISLANIFATPLQTLKTELLNSKVVLWSKDPYAKGAYSYSTPKTSAALKELMQPVDNKLFFAGEALCNDSSVGSTVEAAFASGREVAKKVLEK